MVLSLYEHRLSLRFYYFIVVGVNLEAVLTVCIVCFLCFLNIIIFMLVKMFLKFITLNGI